MVPTATSCATSRPSQGSAQKSTALQLARLGYVGTPKSLRYSLHHPTIRSTDRICRPALALVGPSVQPGRPACVPGLMGSQVMAAPEVYPAFPPLHLTSVRAGILGAPLVRSALLQRQSRLRLRPRPVHVPAELDRLLPYAPFTPSGPALWLIDASAYALLCANISSSSTSGPRTVVGPTTRTGSCNRKSPQAVAAVQALRPVFRSKRGPSDNGTCACNISCEGVNGAPI